MMNCDNSFRAKLQACVAQGKLPDFVAALTSDELRYLQYNWHLFSHAHQLPPAGNWLTWVLMGGRGCGKTRAGAEWVRGKVSGEHWAGPKAGNVALIGQTYADVREVMIEGVSGLLSVHPPNQKPQWNSSRRRLEWPNGAVARAFSSEDPEALRGPQFDAAWCDEAGKWSNATETFDMLQFGLRLGTQPQQLVTTTPKPTPLIKALIAGENTVITKAATKANAAFLAEGFLKQMATRYGGTRLGRQELDGELIEDREDALFARKWFEAGRVKHLPELQRIVVAIDPPATSGKRADACGIVATGITETGDLYVLRDRTAQGLRPSVWAQRALSLYHELSADCLLAEVNQGGEMVREVIAGCDDSVPVKSVHATHSKRRRAEPVALLYEQGRVHHCGVFPELEDELADFGVDGLSNGKSPDRLDALVWSIAELTSRKAGKPRMRTL
ncbi:terminase family protein [Pseudovibrio sp. Tun.PSC04-5.I4]|uniref:DNA-packaging protein n=1 Tax=Pseudovibrio sp. Tun.PSC04-5.I4 TaxID=1798213 RepID=UPI001FCBA87A|nr:terminase family protein [Pseudovibrio sp. Tun.PSC04-5.I4]